MNDNTTGKYIQIKKATKVYGIPAQTFRSWEKNGKIKCLRTPTNLRMFSVEDIELALGIRSNKIEAKKFIYCRVSSNKQRDDLQRQIQELQGLYPNHSVVTDVASGINFSRKGLQTILEQSMQGKLEEVVVAHKDRLCRFGFELIEFIINRNGGSIKVLDNTETNHKTENEELAEDLLSIIHVFNCKQMGKRRYGNKKSKSENLSNAKTI